MNNEKTKDLKHDQDQNENKDLKKNKMIVSLENQKPKIFVYQNPKKERTLSFKDRLNTEYVVIDEQLSEIGYAESFKDYVLKNKNPIIDKDAPIYGLGKPLIPKTKEIQNMKDTINKANENLNSFLNEREQAIKELEAKQLELINTHPTTKNNENEGEKKIND